MEEAMLVFDEIYRCYYKRVFNYINGLVKDRAQAEDLSQDTLLKVFRSLGEVDEGKNLSPWIFKIARNTCIDYFRRKKPEYCLDGDTVITVPEADNPECIMLERETRDKLREALGMMTMEYRRVLLLREFGSMSYRDIAGRLNLRESSVKTILHRGRRKLQKLYMQVY